MALTAGSPSRMERMEWMMERGEKRLELQVDVRAPPPGGGCATELARGEHGRASSQPGRVVSRRPRPAHREAQVLRERARGTALREGWARRVVGRLG